MLEIIRDLFLVLAALASFLFFALLVVVAWEAWTLVKALKTEAPTLLATAQRTAGTIEGTVAFMSERAVAPTFKWLGLVAAVLRFLQILLGRRG